MGSDYDDLRYTFDDVGRRVIYSKPKRGCVKREVLRFWREDCGRVATYSQLKRRYLKASRDFGFGASEDYVSMNLTRILKKHGKKCGQSGSHWPWVLRIGS